MPREIEVKTILNKSKKRDSWFLSDYTVNPYSSCGFNCLFCYIRGSRYGANLESSLTVKTNALELLDRQLFNRAKKGEYGIVVLSSATEPYQRIEEKYKLTRGALELLLKYKFPVHVITRSNLVERDYDLLHKIDKEAILPKDLQSVKRGTIVSFSFSTIHDEVADIFEPGATSPSERLSSLKNTIDQKFLTGISMMPLLPYISDTKVELERMFSTWQHAKVDYVLPATITLFGNDKTSSKTLVMNAISKHYPELEEKYQRFFNGSTELPEYYRRAFNAKMKELVTQYGLYDSIVETARRK